jgi:hypothetical protein
MQMLMINFTIRLYELHFELAVIQLYSFVFLFKERILVPLLDMGCRGGFSDLVLVSAIASL